MALQGYVQIVGKKQGQFKGDTTNERRKDWIELLGFSFELISPRDAASGRPSGKRQWKPITFLKQWDAASPQVLAAAATNEVLGSVVFEFERPNPDGTSLVFETVKLTNATIAEVRQYTDDNAAPKLSVQRLEMVQLSFEKIEVSNVPGKTTFMDDWEARV